ncbi:hypothetical protein PG5_57420 [Pseudomonas sp. G5(2012)]|nr:hypothetical protein PG5_57420 [Pseudomonas sp. G5(2012)]
MFSESLGAALANSTKLTEWMIFLQLRKKAPHQSVDLKKIT